MFFSYPVITFAFMFLVLYGLVLSRASAITTTPNTFLSLLPTAAVSGISWIPRKKFINAEGKNDQNTPKDNTNNGGNSSGSMEATSRDEPDAVDSELIPLLPKF